MVTKLEASKKEIDTKNGKQKLTFLVRPNTTDTKVIDEIIDRKSYQHKRLEFDMEPTDVWLDLGANIGVFTCLAIAKGGRSYGYEPDTENFAILKKNLERFKKEFKHVGSNVFKQGVSTESGKVKLYLTKRPENKYRHTIIPVRGRKTVEITVKTMDDILKKHPKINAVKMDIEGIEITILENFKAWKKNGIQKLVLEYSFDFDKSIPRFAKIIKTLKSCFKTVHFTKVDIQKRLYRQWH